MLTDYFKKDNELNTSLIKNLSKPYRHLPYNLKSFKKEFQNIKDNTTLLDTPMGKVEIYIKSQFFKLSKWKEDRTKLVGLIKSTLQSPLVIVSSKHDEKARKYIGTFVTKENHLINVVICTENINGVNAMKTAYQVDNRGLKKNLSVADENLLHFRYGKESLKTPHIEKNLKNSTSVADIVQQPKEFVKSKEIKSFKKPEKEFSTEKVLELIEKQLQAHSLEQSFIPTTEYGDTAMGLR